MEFLPAPDPPRTPIGELHLWSIALGREPAPQRRAASNAALRRILGAYLRKGAAEIVLARGGNGKPRLVGDELEFNLSHSGTLALVAVSAEYPVGVDVEEIRPDRDPLSLAQRALEPADVEAVRVAVAAERAAVFHQRWARHEARLKCAGAGIFRASLLETGTFAIQDLEPAPGYAAAVAVDAPRLPPLRAWTFSPPALQNDGNRVS